MTDTDDMTVGGIVGWIGAKRAMADDIVQELGPHSVYFEPFCGSLAVLLGKPPCSHETVSDLHGDLINLTKVIAHQKLGTEFYRRVRREWLHEARFHEARDHIFAAGDLEPGQAPDVERAVMFFLISWLGRSGAIGSRHYNLNFCVRYTGGGGHGGVRFGSAVNSVPAWRRRMRRVTILCRDAFEIIEGIADDDGVAVYVDPPYLKKGFKYVHDFEPKDHRRLAEALRRFRRARVVVSYYEHPALDELYPRWTRRPLYRNKAVRQACGRVTGKVLAPEVLLLNGPSLAPSQHNLFAAS